jgi:alpha,alpha-trehalase
MKKLIVICFLLACRVVYAQSPSPRQLYPGLFERVQSSAIFSDNKLFVDAIPKHSPKAIIQSFNREKWSASFNLKQFVLANFTLPDSGSKGFTSDITDGVRKHIDTLWQVLQRIPDTLKGSSLIPLPYPYIVPGGRFREVYYRQFRLPN